MTFINGMRIIESLEMVEIVGEDWSKVRSPARARRRRKKHRQNIKPIYAPKQEFLQMGDMIICHPVMAAKLRRAAEPIDGSNSPLSSTFCGL